MATRLNPPQPGLSGLPQHTWSGEAPPKPARSPLTASPPAGVVALTPVGCGHVSWLTWPVAPIGSRAFGC
jgi:hypothetical protein